MLFRSLNISVLAIAALLAIAPVGAVARSHATPTPSATPSPPPEDPAITTIAKREFVAWQAGVLHKERYAAPTQAQLTDQKITATSQGLGHLGIFDHAEWVGPLGIQDGPPGVKGYIYKMVCSNAPVYEFLTLDADGKIAGIFFRDKLAP